MRYGMNFKKHLIEKAIHLKAFIIFLSNRAQNDTIFRVAASLSYTSLIAIVPLFAIGLAIFSAFPVFDGVKEQVQEFLIQNFVPTIEKEVSQYFTEFLSATAQLTTIGVIGITITAILMLSTIEDSLNFIFKVYKPRQITTKITLYWTVITLGPLLLGVGFSLRGYLFTLQKFMPDSIVTTQIYLSNIIPTIISFLALIMIYVLVPNKKVSIPNAIIGALVAIILFWILRKGFGLIILKSATYKTLYGALATLPIFLVWMFSAWSVVIFGAVVTASIGEFKEMDGKENSRKSTIFAMLEKRSKKNNDKKTKKLLQKEQK